jgi:hypothetical protein
MSNSKTDRANSQHSTGPRSDEGKAKSSLNAIKTGLTGRTSQTRSVSVAQAVSPGGFACVSPFVIHL